MEHGWVCWSWSDETNAEVGTRKSEHQGEPRPANDPFLLFRVPHSAFRDWFFGRMSITVVLHEPQDLVNIAHVVRFERLEDALLDCVHVVGFTARGRTAKRNLQRPRDAAAEILIQADAGPTALLYGREDKGLPNEALDLCHRVVTIPTNPAYPSLNLAHAVVLMLYELALARGDDARPFKAPRREGGPVTVDDLERLFADAEAALRGIEFFKTREVEGVMRTLREVMHRTPLDQREAKLLRAMAIEVVKYSERLARSRLHVDR